MCEYLPLLAIGAFYLTWRFAAAVGAYRERSSIAAALRGRGLGLKAHCEKTGDPSGLDRAQALVEMANAIESDRLM